MLLPFVILAVVVIVGLVLYYRGEEKKKNNENFDTVQMSLLQAGIHLAGLLNEIYG